MRVLVSYKKLIFGRRLWFIFLILLSELRADDPGRRTDFDFVKYRGRVLQMFYHAYDSYLKYAYPYDELRPLSCDGHDTWGSYSLTLIDALDTLIVMGNHTEFRRIAKMLIEKSENFFDIDINASVFETNIRVVGGLISAHLLSHRAGMVLEPGWPCSGPLLRMAENIARKLLPAFDTPTGMPYGTVNLQHGVPKGETTITCTAGVGTFILEMGTISRLTGDPIFEKVAMRALQALWEYKSPIGLVGNHIDVADGKWTALDAGIGGGIDSYFEYLAKGSVMFQIPELLDMFKVYQAAVEKFVKRDDWYMWAHMKKGGITLPVFTSLDCYWPGIQGMVGNVEKGMKTLHNFHQVWKQFGFTPEYYSIPKAEPHQGREGYPLRPELIESAVYLYQATKDPYVLEIGVDILEAIDYSAKTHCGYATVQDVRTHRLEDRMESFFLAETTKYLYLLFDPDNFIHNNGSHGKIIKTPSGECVIDSGGYVFNTEAHPIDIAAVHCCSAQKKAEDAELQAFHNNLNLLELLDISDVRESLIQGRKLQKKEKAKNKKIDQNISTLSANDSAQSEYVSSRKDNNDNNNESEPDKKSNSVEATVVDSTSAKQPSSSRAVVEESESFRTEPKTLELLRKKHSLALASKLLDIFTGLAGGENNQNITEHPNMEHLYSEMQNYHLNYSIAPERLRCPALPFHMRMSVTGEMFDEN